jgi:hypothetical protein
LIIGSLGRHPKPHAGPPCPCAVLSGYGKITGSIGQKGLFDPANRAARLPKRSPIDNDSRQSMIRKKWEPVFRKIMLKTKRSDHDPTGS